MSSIEDCNCDQFDIDYYGVLSLTRNCTDLEIKQAFRRLAVRHHPDHQEENQNNIVFNLIAEAYEVLSDPAKKAVYDRYGEEGLKNGVAGAEEFIKPYIYHGEPMRTYREFFGSENPYADLLRILTQPLPLLEYPEGRGIKKKEEPLLNPLHLTLEEVYFGGVKKMKIHRLVLMGCENRTTELREQILTIPIKPGVPTGTRIVFPEMGDQGATKIPADVIFVVEDRPHEVFQRHGSDLHMTHDVFLSDALVGTTITANTIDDRTLKIPITSVITPDYRKIVANEGLPLPEDPRQKGNLIINFNIEFPIYVPVSNKDYVKQALDSSYSDTEMKNTGYIHRLILANKMRKSADDDVLLRRDPHDEDARKLELMCNT